MTRYQAIVFFIWPVLLGAQSKLDISAGLTGAFNLEEQFLWSHPVDETFTKGFEVKTAYSYLFREVPLEPVVKIGYKQLFFAGHYETSGFSGITHKFLLNTGGRYWFRPEWAAGMYLNAENNRDLEDFRTQTSDNFRYSTSLEVMYMFQNGLSVYGTYSYAWYPLLGQYLIFNPAHQFSLGLNCRIL